MGKFGKTIQMSKSQNKTVRTVGIVAAVAAGAGLIAGGIVKCVKHFRGRK